MTSTVVLGTGAVLLLVVWGVNVVASVDPAQQPAGLTATSPELESRDQPVTADDLRILFAVEDATRGQDFEQRLRDFNNLPWSWRTTRLTPGLERIRA